MKDMQAGERDAIIAELREMVELSDSLRHRINNLWEMVATEMVTLPEPALPLTAQQPGEAQRLHARATLPEIATTQPSNPSPPLEPPTGLIFDEIDVLQVSSVPPTPPSNANLTYTVKGTVNDSLLVEKTISNRDSLSIDSLSIDRLSISKEIDNKSAGARTGEKPKKPKLVLALQNEDGSAKFTPMFAAQGSAFDKRFADLWIGHPAKIDRERAMIAAAKLSPDEFDLLVANAPAWFIVWEGMVASGEGQYIPRFVNFINREQYRNKPVERKEMAARSRYEEKPKYQAPKDTEELVWQSEDGMQQTWRSKATGETYEVDWSGVNDE